MHFRPRQAQWFETYVPRAQTVHVLGLMADSGAVELESDPRLAQPLGPVRLRESIEAFARLRAGHPELFSGIEPRSAPLLLPPEEEATRSLAVLEKCCRREDELRETQQALQRQQEHLQLLQEFLQSLHGAGDDVSLLANNGPFLYTALFACTDRQLVEAKLCSLIDEFVAGPRHDFFLVADLADKRDVVERCYQVESCQRLEIPADLPTDPSLQLAWLRDRLHATATALEENATELRELSHQAAVAEALDSLQLLGWYVEQAPGMGEDPHFCHVTGWILEDRRPALERTLRDKGFQLNLRLTPPPEEFSRPVCLTLPDWAHPFGQFIEMMGSPGANEVNPALLLPLTISLLFGYMFPDVGHGLLLALASLLLYRSWPPGRFLLYCGLSAAGFGLVFGEVFGQEGMIEPLWISPLDEPLLILLPPLFLGVILMLTGLVFNGIEARWRGELRGWMLRDAPVLMIYASACVGLFFPVALWLAAAGLAWFLVGQLLAAGDPSQPGPLASLAMLLQGLLELLLNSFSFIRVGAFALAHAALSSAVLQIGNGIESPFAKGLFLVLGHGLIIGVEGLVVYVQTSRLVLFEFFVRFLKGEGRILRPLNRPQPGQLSREGKERG